MMPQLVEEARAQPHRGESYITTGHGRPYKSGPTLGMAVQRWTTEAGLTRRSSHGVRKAAGRILAEAGATQHQIMAVMAHTQPQTSAIYTDSVERALLAEKAMATVEGLRIE